MIDLELYGDSGKCCLNYVQDLPVVITLHLLARGTLLVRRCQSPVASMVKQAWPFDHDGTD